MKSRLLYYSLLCFFTLCFSQKANAQISFLNSNSSLQRANFKSGGPVCVIDWNNDGRDDIVRMEAGHKVYVEIQDMNGLFDSLFIADFGGSPGWAWAMAVADVDKNGYNSSGDFVGLPGMEMIGGGKFTNIFGAKTPKQMFTPNIIINNYAADPKAVVDAVAKYVKLNGSLPKTITNAYGR
jgi:hypothetical protein